MKGGDIPSLAEDGIQFQGGVQAEQALVDGGNNSSVQAAQGDGVLHLSAQDDGVLH